MIDAHLVNNVQSQCRTFSNPLGNFRWQDWPQEVQLLVLLLVLQLSDGSRHVHVSSPDAATRQGAQVYHGLRQQHVQGLVSILPSANRRGIQLFLNTEQVVSGSALTK